MKITRQFIALFLILWMPSWSVAQRTNVKGNIKVQGNISLGFPLFSGLAAFAQLPLSWVDNHQCDPPGGIYNVTRSVKASGGFYPGTFAGLLSAYTDWKNAADEWWLIQVDAGLNIHSSTFDSNNSLVTFAPGKAGATKCIVFASSTPTTNSVIVCSHGLPGYGGTRNPGCSSDIAKMWTTTVDSSTVPGKSAILIPGPLSNGAVGTNHVLIRDMEGTIAPGQFQSASGVDVTLPLILNGDHIGVTNSYFHGFDPGDSGQPGSACSGWNKSGTVTATNGSTAVTWVSGGRFGIDFADSSHSPGYPQATINIGGTNYTILTHDPAVSDTALTLSSNFTGTTGTNAYTLTNPATKYATGCGDDQRGTQMNCDTCWMTYSYIEKQHWFASEGHSISTGQSVGPIKIVHNWVECAGGACIFFGGSDADKNGGPSKDIEVRGNAFIRDLDWRLLTGGSGGSPHPPFGCGPLDGNAAHDTCPLHWSIKNNIEFKVGNRVLVDGNIVGGNWADGQSGYVILLNVRSSSGGTTGGIFDPVTGLPLPDTENLTITNNWVWGSPQGVQFSTRSGSPGNGGGVSKPMQGFVISNNAFTWIGDDTAFGAPGPDFFQWSAGENSYRCVMSRTAGVAHAACTPIQIGNLTGGYDYFITDNAFDTQSITSVANVVTVKLGAKRHDPTVGGNFTIAGTPGWNGTFTISGASISGSSPTCTQDYNNQNVPPSTFRASQPQPCTLPDGTYGDTITYTDTINSPGTASLCTSTVACNALNAGVGVRATLDTLAYKMTDISVGDAVFVPAVGVSGSPGCIGGTAPTEYQVGGTAPIVPAIAPTNPAGLDVYYANAFPAHDPDNSGTVCEVRNGGGWPAHTMLSYNHFLSPDKESIGSPGLSHGSLHLDNHLIHNVFVTHDTGTVSDVICASPAAVVNKEGTMGTPGVNPMSCWDPASIELFDNVLVTRNPANWSVLPIGSPINFFPATPTCSGAAPDGTCAGFLGFMSATPFQVANCVFDGTNRNNCPMTPLPWSTNFSLNMIRPFNGTSTVFGRGANINAVEDAFTRTIYVCPVGSNCGTHGPYTD